MAKTATKAMRATRAEDRPARRRFTVDEYYRMGEAGIPWPSCSLDTWRLELCDA